MQKEGKGGFAFNLLKSISSKKILSGAANGKKAIYCTRIQFLIGSANSFFAILRPKFKFLFHEKSKIYYNY